VKQRYVGPSSWEFLARVKRLAGSRTILGSGDLFTSAAVRRMMDETGVDGVTVARGSIGNPFIFRESRALLNGRPISPPSVAEQREAIEFQFAETLKLHGAAHAGVIFRKFGICYANLHPVRDEVRQAFINTNTTQGILNILALWYDDKREWPTVTAPEMPRDLIAAGAEE
jgi:tRNA-dihydrouridine synthase